MEQRFLMVPGLDSLAFEKETFTSDSVKKQANVTSRTVEKESAEEVESLRANQIFEKSERLEDQLIQPQQAQRQEFQPTPRKETEMMAQNPVAITRLEQENRYLRSERDRLLTERTQQPQQQRPQIIRRTTTTNQTTVREEPRINESENRVRRNRWWRPFAAAGGVAATAAILSEQDENDPSLPDPIASPEVATVETNTINQKQLDDISMAITSSIIGTAITVEMMDQKDTTTPSQRAPDPVIREVILRDTVYVDNDPIINILKSKEAIYFKVNQRVPDDEEINKLNDLASFIKENEEYGLVLTGFADNTGNVTYNLKLADERMNNVGNILLDRFSIPQEKLRFESGGQVIRGTRHGSNDLDRKVEVRAEMIEKGEG